MKIFIVGEIVRIQKIILTKTTISRQQNPKVLSLSLSLKSLHPIPSAG